MMASIFVPSASYISACLLFAPRQSNRGKEVHLAPREARRKQERETDGESNGKEECRDSHPPPTDWISVLRRISKTSPKLQWKWSVVLQSKQWRKELKLSQLGAWCSSGCCHQEHNSQADS